MQVCKGSGISWDDDTVKAIGEFFDFGGEALKTVANIVIPPPGDECESCRSRIYDAVVVPSNSI